ncbi:MAG: phosphoglycerate dehydrogenase [Oscillospiraceae bacterium]
MKILVTPTSMQPGKPSAAMDKLKAFTGDLVFNPKGKPLTEDELIPLLADCDGYIAGLDQVTEKVLKACPKLKVVSRYGVGYDAVDVKAANELGITVTNTPGANSQGVAELAFALIISLARRIPMLDRKTKEGGWVRSTGIELHGKTIGIVGLGAIGRALANCCTGFGMNIIAYDPYINETYCKDHNIAVKTLDEVLTQSDIISLHLPLTDETRHMINAETIAKMKKGAIVVNASRGAIVDEEAAYEALVSGQLGGLGLDAFEVEPPVGNKLMELDSVCATPHTGAHTYEAVENMQNMAVDNAIAILTGKECKFIVH